MLEYILIKLIDSLNKQDKALKNRRILSLGIDYKKYIDKIIKSSSNRINGAYSTKEYNRCL